MFWISAVCLDIAVPKFGRSHDGRLFLVEFDPPYVYAQALEVRTLKHFKMSKNIKYICCFKNILYCVCIGPFG